MTAKANQIITAAFSGYHTPAGSLVEDYVASIDDQLSVSGDIFVGGDDTDSTADRYLKITDGVQMSASLGYRVTRAGSLTGISAQFYVSNGPFGLGEAGVSIMGKVNGVTAIEAFVDVSAIGYTGVVFTQVRGIDQFVVDDIISLYIDLWWIGTPNLSVGDILAFVEVVYDPD